MTHWKHLVVALVAAFALAACSSSSDNGGTASTEMMPDPETECTEGGGRWNADETCTSAEEFAAARAAMQRSAIMTAIGTASTAVAAVDNDSTDAEVSAADDAIADARTAIANADDVPDAETAANTGTVDALASRLTAAKMARQTAMDDAQRAADMAMAATAAKLHAGISMPTATGADTADTDAATGTRFAGYVTTAGTPAGASVGDIVVGISNNPDVALSEDKDTMVAALNGWTGKRYTRSTMSATQGTYEAHVYSHVGEPTQGDKFGQIGVTTAAAGYEYGLNAEGFLSTDVETTPTQIKSPSFDHSAGLKSFELGTNRQYVSISGTYHGVSGEYRCTPGAGNTCAAQVAAEGFNLGGLDTADPPVFGVGNAEWTFKPTNPEARVMSTPDNSYASYGWWLHMAADGDLTASAFVARRGDAEAAAGITVLQGTATYVGGAAGKYALSSTTGGTNDAGHFTARATLEADFGDNMITGTIDNFIGADGQSRNWSVELEESTIGDTGPISSDGTAGGAGNETVWTIGETAADESGSWTGSLQENGDDGVPAIATGTFYTEYDTAGKMVGAFGANKQ